MNPTRVQSARWSRAGAIAIMLALVAGCGPARPDDGDDDDAPGGTLRIEPRDLTVTVVDGAAVAVVYRATVLTDDGSVVDVTDQAELAVDRAGIGSWSSATLRVAGVAAGPARVIATVGDRTAETGLTVRVTGRRFDGAVPPDAPALFGVAVESAALAPTIAYPPDDVLIPPNLGALDVHWRDLAGNDLFEVSLANPYVDLHIYKDGSGEPFTTITATEWAALASSGAPLTLTVSGLDRADPTVKGTAPPQRVTPTNESIAGGVYYWTTQPAPAIYRHDLAEPLRAPEPYFPPGEEPSACIGCHGLSRDGTRMALTLDVGEGRGTIVDVATRGLLVPIDTDPQRWSFATFSPDAHNLITVYQGELVLRATEGGRFIRKLDSSPGHLATHPELSPDGTRLANVETTDRRYDYEVYDGTIVTRTYDQASDGFGPIEVLVPSGPAAHNYYPSWSPDGQWIAFTRTTGTSYHHPSAELWVVRSDGSQPPVRLGRANLGAGLENSWPRWAPFAQTVGPRADRVYYLTFSTMRPFGVRASGGTQIWMAPFFPARASPGNDPSGPAFRLPFQQLASANHIAQWTRAVVPVQ